MRSLPIVAEPPRAAHLPSASQIDRAANCPPSESKPHTFRTTDYSTRGTEGHGFIVRAHVVGSLKALEEIPDDAPHRRLCEALPLDELPAGGDLELAIAWDWRTDSARVLPSREHRDYVDVKPTEFPGTYDYVGKEIRDGALTVVVIDWKFGHKYLGPAAKSKQLRLGALSAARLVGADAARVAYFYPREDGTYGSSWAEFNALDLADIADEMCALAEALANPVPSPVHEGDWCNFCPAFNACEAKISLAHAIGDGSALADISSQVESLTDEELGQAYVKLERFEDVAKRVRDAIRQRAAMQTIDLGDGRTLGTVAWKYTVVNTRIAWETIGQLHDVALAEEVCPRTTTLTAVKKLGKETLQEIERRGGIVTGTKPQVRTHRKKED